MNTRVLAATVAVGLAAAGGLYAVSDSPKDAVQVTAKPQEDGGVKVTQKPRRVGPFDAGADPIVERYVEPTVQGKNGKSHRVVRTVIVDRTDPENRDVLEVVEEVQPDCLRRPRAVANKDCRFLKPLLDGGTMALDVPPSFRFAADAGLGTRCQPVACFITAGENPNE